MALRSSGFIALLVSLLLTACGGDSDNDSFGENPGPRPSSVTVLPADAQVVAGVTRQYLAVATFMDGSQSDVSDRSNWSVADESVATVDSQTGLLTTLAAGTTTVTAVFNAVADEAILTVTSTSLKQLEILPADVSAPVGTTGSYTAIGFFADGSSENVTTLSVWTSSDASAAACQARPCPVSRLRAASPGPCCTTSSR
jgi:uncharacterized protein YjdB